MGCQGGSEPPLSSPRVRMAQRQGGRGKRHTARGRAALLSAVVRQHGGNRPCLLHWPIFREGGGQRVPRDRDGCAAKLRSRVAAPTCAESQSEGRPRCRWANRQVARRSPPVEREERSDERTEGYAERRPRGWTEEHAAGRQKKGCRVSWIFRGASHQAGAPVNPRAKSSAGVA